MSNCDDRENEKRDLVPRLLPLSHDDFNDVMFCGMLISSADDWDEALRLLDKYPLSYVHRFLSVQKDQAKARSDAEKPAATPDDDTATVVDVAFDTLEVEVSKLSTEDCAKRLEAFLWEAPATCRRTITSRSRANGPPKVCAAFWQSGNFAKPAPGGMTARNPDYRPRLRPGLFSFSGSAFRYSIVTRGVAK